MALSRSFYRVAQALGRHITVSAEELENHLSGRPVGLVLGPECARDGNCRWTAQIVTNLVARLYPVLCLSGADGPCADAAALAKAINPKIEILERPGRAVCSAAIGKVRKREGSLYPYSSGWVSGLRPVSAGGSGAPNPLAAAFAGGLVVAEMFKVAFQEALAGKTTIVGTQVSLLDYSKDAGADEELGAIDLGEVAFAGLGAVGNAGIWALSRHEGLSGKAHLVDHQSVDESNLQRYVLAMDADEHRPKTEIAARELRRTGLVPEEQPLRLHEFAAGFPSSFPVPAVCVSVDNFTDRRVAQALLPRLVVNGYTGTGNLGASWHRFGVEGRQCLACLYRGAPHRSDLQRMEDALGLPMPRLAALHALGSTLTGADLEQIAVHVHCEVARLAEWTGKGLYDVYQALTCGQLGVEVRGNGEEEVVPLAHQSALAGIMMAAELVKRLTPAFEARAQRSELAVWSDVTTAPPSAWTHTSPQSRGCICRDPDYLEVYERKWGV